MRRQPKLSVELSHQSRRRETGVDGEFRKGHRLRPALTQQFDGASNGAMTDRSPYVPRRRLELPAKERGGNDKAFFSLEPTIASSQAGVERTQPPGERRVVNDDVPR
jgi:hypothetical protein